MCEVCKRYSEDQPRDPDGKFASGGGEPSKELVSASKLYSQGFEDGHKIAYVSGAVCRGENIAEAGINAGATDEHVAAAQLLVQAVRDASPDNLDLYRSMFFAVGDTRPGVHEMKDALLKAKAGDTITLDRLSSFTTDRPTAAFYGSNGKDRVSIELKIEGESKSLATDSMTGMEHFERITTGKFEVVDIGKASAVKLGGAYVGTTRYARTVVLRQRSVF